MYIVVLGNTQKNGENTRNSQLNAELIFQDLMTNLFESISCLLKSLVASAVHLGKDFVRAEI